MRSTLSSMQEARRERSLIQRSREGDRDAFDELVRDQFERVHAFLLRMIGNHEDAEDLAQECFVRAFRSLTHFRGESRFSTWLYRIATHLARDHYRARERRERMSLSLPIDETLSESLEGEEVAPPESLTKREEVDALARSIQKLPHALRVALVLRVLEGLDYDEVAQVTGLRAGTVRTQVMKARRKLREDFERREGDSA